MESRFINAVATVATWRELAAEAKRLKAHEAHAELAAAVAEGDAVVTSHAPLYARVVELRAIHTLAQSKLDAASAQHRAGHLSPMDFASIQFDARAAQMLEETARNEIITLLNRGIEARDRVLLAPFRRASAVVEAIVRTSLDGHNQSQFAAMADLDDTDSAAWEPIAIARALREYPELARDPGYKYRCDSLDQLKDCFAYRAARRAGRTHVDGTFGDGEVYEAAQ